ncbi:PTS-dependent dihydroxyacetone kinase phosphotransferase subunit DhaM [Listeria grandensis]|uniref:phosphoenolpyruvate--glycerone phosphotransferase n=1 Tax=Listeria grandensis FSL F6-0971 TaxID=1265819 RepID=W7B374_9LIST|nr:dihydroxyacetone kinase phosphoryl donor subunit DhaM [Listeria grandensis]EUJ21714.1 PTS system mannnose-specific family transporter subunit IIA [Listeria grandensis FSL F6-0971]MBC1474022.1 PTS-dependent dihydroxyacetone kinase phosphotransferase subunit DhaM [Listeria grandensis]MBC6316203.1 PTS-dependent dihydroxyacetone kinase phosphotransferase subunit DhaM [Listeria grandensis]
MTKKYGIVIVSHSADVAYGIHQLIQEVARDVAITHVGGTDDGKIGTSFEKVSTAFETNEADHIYAFYDLGSAKMNIETIQEISDKEIILFDVPILEGAYITAAQLQMDESTQKINENLKTIIIK